ncbi:MAG TPA: hypothetical protein VFD30_18980 [Terriglobia bacterium]|jgi:hypothetical protein|nr:hypothetical protein [Terriglobia bacterium]
MTVCEATPTLWKGRRGYRLSNNLIHLTVLLGGGHLADFRFCGSPHNVLFESPWSTIEPFAYAPEAHSRAYGEGPVGKFLSGFTGHALVLGYFGMPSPAEAARGLPLHGEAACAEWQVLSSAADEAGARLSLEVLLPVYRLRLQRNLYLSIGASSILVEEHLTNQNSTDLDYQWVEHATFGEPFFAGPNAQLFLSANLGRTWPEGYEGKELLIPDCDFNWPRAPTPDGTLVDLSKPFVGSGTGFVAALLTQRELPHGTVAVENPRLGLAAGYVFDHQHFPWIALWEENLARIGVPWSGKTRARGVEFGTSPMPTGRQHALRTGILFDTPTFATLAARQTVSTCYQLFLTATPAGWSRLTDLEATSADLRLHDTRGQHLQIPVSRKP